MARTVEERTLKMKQNYVALRSAGMYPAEIAEEFSLSRTTVYQNLNEIAKEAGVERDSLLRFPRYSHISINRASQHMALEPLDLADYRVKKEETLAMMSELIQKIDEDIKSQEAIASSYEEGE